MTSFHRSPQRGSARRRGRGTAVAVCAVLLGVPGLVAAGPASALPVAAPSGTPAPTTTTAAPTTPPASLQEAADAAVAAGAAGYVARVDDGRRVTTAVAGLADRATGRRLRPDDQFEVGSNTKTFMSALTLQLVAQGRLRLTDSVERLLPGVVPDGDRITLRMLLQHTSGLFNYTDDEAFIQAVVTDPQRVWTPAEIVRVATAHAPTFAPGTSWAYSNTNYILVGMILARVTGHSPADLLQQRIARPLGLHRTYLVTDVARNTGPGYAHGYYVTFENGTPAYTDISGWALGGWAGTAGAVVSTPAELARFFQALLAGKVVPPAQLAEMKRTVPIPLPTGNGMAEGVGYGLGLFRQDTPCGTVWGHGGDTIGHHSTAVVTEDGRRSAVADATTQLDPRMTPGDAAKRFATAVVAADRTAVCRMFGKSVPASAPADPLAALDHEGLAAA